MLIENFYPHTGFIARNLFFRLNNDNYNIDFVRYPEHESLCVLENPKQMFFFQLNNLHQVILLDSNKAFRLCEKKQNGKYQIISTELILENEGDPCEVIDILPIIKNRDEDWKNNFFVIIRYQQDDQLFFRFAGDSYAMFYSKNQFPSIIHKAVSENLITYSKKNSILITKRIPVDNNFEMEVNRVLKKNGVNIPKTISLNKSIKKLLFNREGDTK